MCLSKTLMKNPDRCRVKGTVGEELASQNRNADLKIRLPSQ